MTSLKLKYKIETLHKILKYSDENNVFSKLSDSKVKNKPSSAKQSVRSSKILNNDYENLPGFEQEISRLTLEEKEDVMDLIKSIDLSSLLSIFTILQNRQYYFKIKSKIGLDIVRTTFKEIIKIKNETSSNTDIINLQDTLFINDECELFYSLRDIINLSELDAMDLFDLFKFNEFFAITEQIFIILIYLLAANEDGHLEDFFQIFFDDIFGFISGGEKFISVSCLKEIGRILGINEKDLAKAASDLTFDLNSYVDVGKFKEFYAILAKMHDEQFKSQLNFIIHQQNQQPNTNIKGGSKQQQQQHQEGKAKTNTGCMSKACNIL